MCGADLGQAPWVAPVCDKPNQVAICDPLGCKPDKLSRLGVAHLTGSNLTGLRAWSVLIFSTWFFSGVFHTLVGPKSPSPARPPRVRVPKMFALIDSLYGDLSTIVPGDLFLLLLTYLVAPSKLETDGLFCFSWRIANISDLVEWADNEAKSLTVDWQMRTMAAGCLVFDAQMSDRRQTVPDLRSSAGWSEGPR